MKSLLVGATLLAVGGVAGGATLYLHPELAGQVQRSTQQWVDELRSPTATPLPTISFPPGPVDSYSPSRNTPAASAPSPSPVVLTPLQPPQTEAPQPPAAGFAWTSDDCTWSLAVLQRDAKLDSDEAARLANGLVDPNYPQATAAYYYNAAGQWTGDSLYAATYCHDRAWPTDATRYTFLIVGGSCAQQEQEYATAIFSHQSDMQNYPRNSDWDRQWVAIYARLNTLWQEACQ